MILFACSNIFNGFDPKGVIGSKVTDSMGFLKVLGAAVERHDTSTDRIEGQSLVSVPEAVPFVSSGVGHHQLDPSSYVLRFRRGRVSAYLKRKYAAPVEDCSVVVYTTEAYLKDPDVDQNEVDRILKMDQATHVIVALLAFAGPESKLSPLRFVANLAGGNNEAMEWSADEIRAKAAEVLEYHDAWAVVADEG